MKTIKLFIILLLFIQSTLMNLPDWGLVLCLGEEGHIALEIAETAGHCHHDPNTELKSGHDIVLNQPVHFHGCVDIPLVVGQMQKYTGNRYHSPNVMGFGKTPISDVVVTPPSHQRFNLRFAGINHLKPASTRSTVLLI